MKTICFICIISVLLVTTIALDCSNDQVEAIINRRYIYFENVNNKEYVSIILGTTVVFRQDYTLLTDYQLYKSVCIDPNSEYTVKLGGTTAWDPESRMRITINGLNMIGEQYLSQAGSKTYTFKYYQFKYYQAEIQYSDISQIDNSWTSLTYDDHLWESKIPESFPDISTVTRYYRFTQNFESSELSVDSIYALSMFVKDGYVIYINGKELFRYGLPPVFDASTYSTISNTEYEERIFGIPLLSLIVDNKIIIAIELHRGSVTGSVIDEFKFSLYGRKKYSGSNMIALSNIDYGCTLNTNTCDGSKLFDNDLSYDSYISVDNTELTNFVIFKGATYLNGYSIFAESYYNSNYNKWSVYGTIDGGNTWFLFDSQSSKTIGSLNTYESVLNSYSIMINGMKIVFSNTKGLDVQIFEIRPIVGTKYDNTDIQYESSLFSSYTGTQINIIPTLRTITTISIQPSLPNGLSINSNTGVISGIPTIPVNKDFVITGYKSGTGYRSTIISLHIQDPNCPQDGIWPETRMDQTATLKCSDPINYNGSIQRKCENNSGIPTWNDQIIDTCSLKTPEISYSSNSITGSIYVMLPILTPSIIGLQYSLSIDPVLPDGLSLDPITGQIYGVCTSVLDTTKYIISIENISGSNTFELYITIQNVRCTTLDTWSATNAGETAIHSCPYPSIGTITRHCSEYGEWEEIVEKCSGCFGAFYFFENECVFCDHGIVVGDENGNTNCILCDSTSNYIYNNKCIPKNICLASDIEDISWNDTFVNYIDYVSCDNDSKTQTGFYSRQCFSDASWDTVDKSSCKTKSEDVGVDLIHSYIPLYYFVSYQNDDDIDLISIRAVIKSNPYLLYSLYVHFRYPYSSSEYKAHNLHYFIYTSTSYAEKWILNINKTSDDISTNLHLINPKIFNNKIEPTFMNTYIRLDNPPMCTDEYNNSIELDEYTPDQCINEGITNYNKYQCIQNGIEPILKYISTIKCNLTPTTAPSITPSTSPSISPSISPSETPEPISQYIKLEIIFANVDIKNIDCSSVIGIYRSIIISTNSILYNFNIVNYEQIEYNNDIALKVKLFLRTATDLFDNVSSDIQHSLHQSQVFSNNLSSYASINCNNIQVITNEIINTNNDSTNTRRLRG